MGAWNWQATGAFLPATAQPQLTIVPGTPATLYILSNYAMYRSTDGGQTWQPFPVENASVSAFAIAPSQPNSIYASGTPPFGPIYKSTDGGASWTRQAFPVFAYGPGAMAVDPTNPSVIWLVDGGVDIRQSTDAGVSFQVVTSFANGAALDAVAIDPADPARVYVAGNSGIYATSDGGKIWSLVGPAATSLAAAPSRIYTAGGSVQQTVFLAKFDPALSQVVYSTYLWTGAVSAIALDSASDICLAGSDSTGMNGVTMKVGGADSKVMYSMTLTGAVPNAIALDASGNAVIAGTATGLATSKGAYQSTPPSPCSVPFNPFNGFLTSESTHAFVATLDGSGALLKATYVTGSCGDTAYAAALDSTGNIYIAGETYPADFPVTAGAMTAKFPSIYSAGFVAQLSPALDQLTYSSFLGAGFFSAVHAIALDGAGNVYLAGSTPASPTAGAAHALPNSGCPALEPGPGPPIMTPPVAGDSAFVLKMTLSSAPPAFLATVGGTCHAEADSIAFDANGNIWLAGSNLSWDFPTMAPIAGLSQIPPQQLHYYNCLTGFLAELNPSGSAVLSASVTDSYGAVAANSSAVYFTDGLGALNSSGFATGTYSALVAQINPAQAAPIFVDEITQYDPLTPAAVRFSSAVAPGEIVRILGRGIGPQNQVEAMLTNAGTLATSIGGVQVTFNGIPAPLVYAQANQVVAVAPFELTPLTNASVQVQYNGLTSSIYTVPVVAQNPDILAVVNSDWTPNSQSNPGALVVIFLTGLGRTIPASTDGAINRPPLAQPAMAPQMQFSGDVGSVVDFLGAAAGEVAGVSQLNISPTGLVPNMNGQFYGFTVSVGGASAEVYVSP